MNNKPSYIHNSFAIFPIVLFSPIAFFECNMCDRGRPSKNNPNECVDARQYSLLPIVLSSIINFSKYISKQSKPTTLQQYIDTANLRNNPQIPPLKYN